MKLKQRLSFYAVVIFSILILMISIFIYVTFKSEMEGKEYQSLESKTILAALYYLEKDELSLGDHEDIKSQLLKKISRKNIIILDSAGKPVYGEMSSLGDIDDRFLKQTKGSNHQHFGTPDFFYNGIYYKDNQGDFVVIARESKKEFNGRMQSLRHVLIISSIIGLLLIFIMSWYLGDWVYAPVTRIASQIKNRDTLNFHHPILLNTSYQELKDLVENYNYLVQRISQTFSVQKNFIDYVSHELRTPISAILGTIEVSNQKKRTIEEYEQLNQQIKEYVNELTVTLDQMLILSGAKTKLEFEQIRVDEIIWRVVENAIAFHQANIQVEINVEDQSYLLWNGNDKLLELAFNNIIENAIKYSQNKLIEIQMYIEHTNLVLSIKDQGIGIPANDINHVTENFYRASNVHGYQGKGIGLSMAKVIFSFHHIDLHIQSLSTGTTVLLKFKQALI